MDKEILEDVNKLSTAVNLTDDNRVVDNVMVEKDKEEWIKSDVHTKSAPIDDPGVGKAVILRNFEFSRNPEFKGKITEQEIFNKHWRQISTILWSDGLIPLESVEPRIVFTRNGTYRIFVTCVANSKNLVMETPETLGKLLNKSKKR